MTAAVFMKAFDAVILSLDRKGSLINYHGVYSYSFFNSHNFAKGRAGKVSPFLGRQLSTSHIFFSSGKHFAHIDVGYCILKRNISPITVEVLFLVS